MMKQFTETIHSDFLIHWTGIDIDQKFDRDWKPSSASAKMGNNIVDAYIARLKNTLKYGFWMTKRETPETIQVNRQEFEKPLVARTCFTELKLSETRKHARKFGRLGIGLKRYYLFDRLGGPMKYLQSGTVHLSFPPYSSFYDKSDHDFEKFSFCKHMCSTRPLTYDLFSESEWRIIYSENIRSELSQHQPDRTSRFIDPRRTDNRELREFYDGIEGRKPEYFLPLDGWLSIIIYPSPEVKNTAKHSTEIRDLIEEVKARKTATGCPDYEYEMWPIEVDLDACSHF